MKIYAFDFDGTLTTKDTLIEFIRYAKGTTKMFLGFALYSPWLILMKLHLYSNYRTKEKIFTHFFRGTNIEDFDRLCSDFANDNKKLLRPEAAEYIKSVDTSENRMYIVSASIDNWVKPFATMLSKNIQVIGTKIEINKGIITGHFLTSNCYGKEKVNRLMEVLPAEKNCYELIAFGDSRGDKEMLAIAGERHYQEFGKIDNSLGEIIRFGIVGVLATLIQYGIYWILSQFIGDDIPKAKSQLWSSAAMTIGYIISFIFNFIASTRFTFQVKANTKRGAGFAFSHIVNYLLQMATFNLFLWLGFSKRLAPIPMFCVCIPINFLLVRFFLKKK